jgi:hypothetical protein
MKSTKFRSNGSLPAFNRENTFIDQEGDVQGTCITLTKREYFAIECMKGYISAGSTGMPHVQQLVDYAIAAADALLDALEPST